MMKNSEINLSETNDVLVSIIKNISLGIIAFDLKGNVTIANDLAFVNIGTSTGFEEGQVENVLQLTSHFQELNIILKDCIGKKRRAFKIDGVFQGGKCLVVKGKPILNGMFISIEDITDKKDSEEATLKALLRGQEEERKRIAKEIHDGLGPMLSAIKMHVEAVQNDLESIEENTLAKLETTYHLIDSVTNDMRSLSHDLMPKIVEDFGLVEALDSLSKTLSNGKMKIIYTQNMDGERFNKGIELNLYRVAQELIHKSLKYSKADKVSLQLLKHTNSLILMVEDNGDGFAHKSQKEHGIGLRNVKTRIKALGGEFTIDSVPGVGVTASIEIPLPDIISSTSI